MQTGVTCVIVDDHPAMVGALETYLRGKGVDVVGTADNGAAALALVSELRPALAIVDLQMREIDGLELTRRIAGRSPSTAVIIYSGQGRPGHLYEALDAGARGFVLKESPLTDLLRAITAVAAGRRFLDPELAAWMNDLHGRGELESLTPRQVQIIRLVAEGLPDGEIAASLSLSVDTVRAHVKRAMARLGASTRSQAVAEAMRRSYIS